jgi:hypothetical protein
VILYFTFRSPVNMVKAGGVAQAVMLPVLSIGALYLRHRKTPPEAASGRLGTIGLWVAAVLICAAVGYGVGVQITDVLTAKK